jgi:hypothetical protein
MVLQLCNTKSGRLKAVIFSGLTVLREVVRKELSSTFTEPIRDSGYVRINEGLTDVRLHGEPAERQVTIVGVLLESLEYVVGFCVVSRAAGDQVNLAAACIW